MIVENIVNVNLMGKIFEDELYWWKILIFKVEFDKELGGDKVELGWIVEDKL